MCLEMFKCSECSEVFKGVSRYVLRCPKLFKGVYRCPDVSRDVQVEMIKRV